MGASVLIIGRWYEFGEAAFDEVALCVEVGVEGIFARPGRIVGDDCQCAFICDRAAQRIGVVGGISHDNLCRQTFDQAVSLRAVAALAGGEYKAHRRTQTTHRHMDLGTQTAAGTSDGLIFRPPFLAPAEC